MNHQKKQFNLSELAEKTAAKLHGDSQHVILDVADLESATNSDASFLGNMNYLQAMGKSKAGVICVDPSVNRSEERNYLVSDNPSRTFQTIVELFHPPRQSPSGFKGIHSTAVLHPTAKIGEGTIIGPQAVIDEGAIIGKNCHIGAGCYVGCNSIVGDDTNLHARVVIREDCRIGSRVIIQPGAVIGSCGFGYITDAKGNHTKLNQVGNVIIEDDVEIGANATIDRARFKSTIIGRGTKIDNLVQIGHGVVVGKHNIIVAQTGIAGSTSTGNYVVLGGQVAVAGHLHLSDGVMVAGKSGVSKSLAKGKYGGIPAVPLAEYNRNAVFLRNIEKEIGKLKAMFTKSS